MCHRFSLGWIANNKIYCHGTKPYKLHTIFVSEFMAFVLNEMRKATQIDDKQYKKAAAKASSIYSGSLAFIPEYFQFHKHLPETTIFYLLSTNPQRAYIH